MSQKLLDETMADMRKVARREMTTTEYIAKWTDTKIGNEFHRWIVLDNDRETKEYLSKEKEKFALRKLETATRQDEPTKIVREKENLGIPLFD